MMSPAINVLLADDHPMIMESIEKIIEDSPGLNVLYKFSTGKQVLDALAGPSNPEIDILILDINMPNLNGLDCMEVIKKKYPDKKVIFLTIYQEEFVVRRLRKLGARAILLKNTDTERLVDVIHKVYNDIEVFDDVENILAATSNIKDNLKLSKREREIIKLIAEGKSAIEIGDLLNLSDLTINTHRRNIMRKLDLSNTAQIAAFAKSSGIIT